ncbi:diguanylate cyclase [Shewanella yunxiaonensis]|uniref:Diguanylate cyclase n=1 Tax=Shewanella yunxiaonensis TaxID=2829809 RepID=A0ABX7YXG0_9GAMM|nr:diguanylate cyclase [Shewanella yunxiaonensis]QUN07392.1 diguanylate cyclase [Shewanella yunxiaonensis]
MRISKRLKLLVVLCVILALAHGIALLNQRTMMIRSFELINHLTEVQLRVDLLRSNLWLLQQFQDQKAINDTTRALENLHHHIDVALALPMDSTELKLLNSLKRHEDNIGVLLNLSRQNFINQQPVDANGTMVLTARYSAIIQSMSEDLLRLQTQVVNKARRMQVQHLYFNGILLSLIAILVTLFSLQTLARFKMHLSTLKKGIKDLAAGDLFSKVKMPKGEEFGEVAEEFNRMKQELLAATHKRDQLQKEVEDQTQRLQIQQEKLRHMAEHDDLTGVLNRGAANVQIELAIERCKRQQQQAALLFIDLDRFKPINDSLGHAAGDAVLKEIAKRLQHSLRASDMIARFGGDEFIVWLEPVHKYEEIELVASKIRNTGVAIPLNEQHLDVGLSIGISVYPSDGHTLAALLNHADSAMYETKKQRHPTMPSTSASHDAVHR